MHTKHICNKTISNWVKKVKSLGEKRFSEYSNYSFDFSRPSFSNYKKSIKILSKYEDIKLFFYSDENFGVEFNFRPEPKLGYDFGNFLIKLNLFRVLGIGRALCVPEKTPYGYYKQDYHPNIYNYRCGRGEVSLPHICYGSYQNLIKESMHQGNLFSVVEVTKIMLDNASPTDGRQMPEKILRKITCPICGLQVARDEEIEEFLVDKICKHCSAEEEFEEE